MGVGEIPTPCFIMSDPFNLQHPHSTDGYNPNFQGFNDNGSGFNPYVFPQYYYAQPAQIAGWNSAAWNSRYDDIFTSKGELAYHEWSRQMVSTMYQNWYNSAPEQMKRAMEAGINPFVAASGIMGSDVGSVAPSSSTPDSQLPNAIASGAGALSSVGGAFGAVAGGVATMAKLSHEIGKIDAETSSLFESMGFTKLQSNALSMQLKYLDKKEQIGVWQMLADYDKTKAEYDNLVANHRNIIANYDNILAQRDLLISQKGEMVALQELHQAETARTEEMTRWAKIEREFFTEHGYKLGSPIDESIRDSIVNGKSFDMEQFGNTVSEYQGKVTSAVEAAKSSESWNYRPSNPTELSAWIGHTAAHSSWLSDLIDKGVSSAKDALTKVANNREFEEDYREAKGELYSIYKRFKRQYSKLKHGGNNQELAKVKRQMDNAYEAYKNYNREQYLLDILSERSTNIEVRN